MRKPKFRKWVTLVGLQKTIQDSVETGEFPEKVFAYLSFSGVKGGATAEWKNTVSTMVHAYQANHIDITVPIIKDAPPSGKESDWSYAGRDWAFYSHLLAKAYGWTIEYIASLDVQEAFSHIQEVLTSEHLDREFDHALSEVPYHYNKATKKSDYKPLKRPYWMRPFVQPLKKFKMKRSLLPVGLIIDLSGMAEEAGYGSIVTPTERNAKKDETKKTKPAPDSRIISGS